VIAAVAAAAALHYQFAASARELSVEVRIAPFPDAAGELSVNEGAEAYLRNVEGTVPVERRGDSWFAPACAARGCTVRYRFALREAAATDDEDVAALYGDVVESPPGSWLLRPMRLPAEAKAELSVSTPQGMRFVAGLPRSPFDASLLEELPYAAFGDFRVEEGSSIIAVARARRRASDEELIGWVRDSAAVVARYYGRFPVEGALVLVLPASGRQIHGRCRGLGGASVLFFLGTDLDIAQARASWELVHELVHLGLPSLPRRHHWAEEGLATYVEPIARARAGELSAAKVWRDMIRGLPQGLPQAGDEGLDRTHTWGRTYWGGALFWLLADVGIRERTGNRFGLEHALRAVVAHGGSIARSWPLRRVLEVGDAAVGTRTLEELYAKMATEPFPVDLDALFRKLGVTLQGDTVAFDDGAPLAAVRRAITGKG